MESFLFVKLNMSISQRQDLTFFNDNSIISDKVLNSPSSYLSIISHIQGTSPTWLVNSLIENGLFGTASLVNNDLNQKLNNRSEVYFISFIQPQEFYNKNCKKNGIDLSILKNFKYIDCFSDLFTKTITNPINAHDQITRLFDDIIKKITASSSSKKIIFIEAPELLLLSTNLTSNQLLTIITKINNLCRQLYIIVPQDSPQLVDLSNTNEKDPVFKISEFLVKLYHRSQLNLNLQPLSTGRANDITGCLTISQGCIPFEIDTLKVLEKEYIFHISKESSVKLFFR